MQKDLLVYQEQLFSLVDAVYSQKVYLALRMVVKLGLIHLMLISIKKNAKCSGKK